MHYATEVSFEATNTLIFVLIYIITNRGNFQVKYSERSSMVRYITTLPLKFVSSGIGIKLPNQYFPVGDRHAAQ